MHSRAAEVVAQPRFLSGYGKLLVVHVTAGWLLPDGPLMDRRNRAIPMSYVKVGLIETGSLAGDHCCLAADRNELVIGVAGAFMGTGIDELLRADIETLLIAGIYPGEKKVDDGSPGV